MFTALHLSATSLAVTSSAAPSGGIGGRVDAGGHEASGVTVIAVPAQGGVSQRTVTRADGTYEFRGLAEGAYFVDFDWLAFDITRRNHVQVTAGAMAQADATLYVSAVCECVTITPPQPVRGRTGQVLDSSGHALPHARLELGGPRAEVGYADGEGRFAVLVPISEPVPLTVSESGFRPATQQVAGAVTAPIVFRLVEADGTNLRDSERFSRSCRCPGDLFTHDGR
jgi:Carboxypeptidase regulatory-like domain